MNRPLSDTLFAEPLSDVGDFRFDAAVADVFEDMIERSVPGYRSIVRQCGLLAAQYAQPGSRLYDLGTSLGATSLAMQAALVERERVGDQPPGLEIVAIDSSRAMIERCRNTWMRTVTQRQCSIPIHLLEADIERAELANASIVTINFTLQFLDPAARQPLLARIYQALLPGGLLILSEKIRFDDPTIDRMHQTLHHAFKRAQGYSELEISQKRESLERVMHTDTLKTHEQRLERSGFRRCSVWFQCFNFVSLIAWRD